LSTTTINRQKNHYSPKVSKKDSSPKWDNHEKLNSRQFMSKFRESMSWYSKYKSGKELRPNVVNWMSLNGFDKTTIQKFNNTKHERCTVTIGTVATCLLNGMPDVRSDFNRGKSTAQWLKHEIQKIIEEGIHDQPQNIEVKVSKKVSSIIPIQDRIKEQAAAMAEEIDEAIDNFIINPEKFDPKHFNLVKLLRGNGVKAAQARYIKSFYQFGQNELLELASSNADDQLREAYRHLPRKHVKKLIEFYQLIMDACEQITREVKINRKPRNKKVKPAEDLVRKLKFKTSDDRLNIVSIPAHQLIKAQSALIYNIKTRKIGYYIAKSSEGLGVKGTKLINFTDMSVQKTLRKPLEQLKELKDQNTQKRVETWFVRTIKTTETKLNGRINEDIILLKTF
jgi:hypothetical protein